MKTPFELQAYIYKVLGEKVQLVPSKIQNDLPIFLAQEYELFESELLGHPCLYICSKTEKSERPLLIQKHIDQILKRWDELYVYVPLHITPYLRRRLIELRIHFIVPDSQFFLPGIVLDLSEQYQKKKMDPVSQFSPSTQALLIYILLHETDLQFRPSDLAKKLGYTPMTMGRSLEELVSAGIGQLVRKGKERWWGFKGPKIKLWELVKPFLRSPVKLRVTILHEIKLPFAGISALAHYTMLSEPRNPTFAISQQQWKYLKKNGVEEVMEGEEMSINLEIWTYDPQLILNPSSAAVDPLSLFLSIEANHDERVEAALKLIMENIKW
jgi:hypothetical protein